MFPRQMRFLAQMSLVMSGAWMVATGLAGCEWVRKPSELELEVAAQSERQWTGVTLSSAGKLFVNFPRWSEEVPISVAEVMADGTLRPCPNEAWNTWEAGMNPGRHFVCVQSVFCDAADRLWVLDPANPQFGGVVEGGPKLVQIDPGSYEVRRVIGFPETVAVPTSYLNDVRIDVDRETAYITDSGAGALIVVDLATGQSRRLLDGHYSTQAEKTKVVIGGEAWRRGDGSLPRVHADGLTLSRDRDYLYYQALTGRHLYRVPTAALRDRELSAEALGRTVELVTESGISDGIQMGPDGWIYLTSLEHHAIRAVDPETKRIEIVVQDERLKWPDSLAFGPAGDLYVTTSQIHLQPDPAEPYYVFRIRVP